MNISTRTILVFVALLTLLGTIAVAIFMLANAHQRSEDFAVKRLNFYKLAEQLRRSSDDLTRMARLYVVTGDPIYEQYFDQIVAIRDGKSPRPQNYEGPYWDFVMAANKAPVSVGKPLSFIDLAHQIGATDEELQKLQEAKSISDQLVKMEKRALAAMKGVFVDDSGNLAVQAQPDPEFARHLLHDASYHRAKAEFMRPIEEFRALVDQRISYEVQAYQVEESRYLNITILMVIFTILLALFSFFHIRERIITPIVSLSQILERVQSGVSNEHAAVQSDDEIGTLNHAFNQMNDKAREMVKGLKQQISDRQRAEEELQLRTVELTSEVVKHQLTEAQLHDAKAKAEQASLAKTEFLANMSHELRTPLNSIIGFSQMLEAETFGSLGNDINKEYVEIIHNSGSHLCKIIGDILDLSKIEAGEEKLEEENVEIHQVVSECIEMMRDRAAKKRLSLPVVIQPELPAVLADRLKVKQMLLNLQSNAIKFTSDGGEVRTEVLMDEQRSIQLRVHDTGIGISPKDQKTVLEPFGQAGDTYTRSHDGTGLGLALVKSQIELHGGTIKLESELGKGTTVTLLFPPERTLSA